jgi:hypothetical protein
MWVLRFVAKLRQSFGAMASDAACEAPLGPQSLYLKKILRTPDNNPAHYCLCEIPFGLRKKIYLIGSTKF